MENQGQKEPGIAIEHVVLLKAHVEIVEAGGKPEYNLRLVGLQRFEAADGKALDVFASFDVMHGVEKPLFRFTSDFVAHYVRKGDKGLAWKDFSSAMALAHIIPYLREFVSNMTNRLPTPALILPPINAYAMIEDFEQRRRQAEQTRQAASKPS